MDLSKNNVYLTDSFGDTNTGYTLFEPTKTHKDVIHKMMIDIFPDKTDRDNFIKMAQLALSGNRDNTMYIFYGKDSNGKSTLITMLMEILGSDYSCLVPESILQLSLNELSYQTVSKIFNKRLVVATSSETRQKLNNVLVTNDNIKVKLLLGTCDVKLNLTCVYIVNDINKIDETLLKNSKIINFNTTFVKNPTKIKNNKILLDEQYNSDIFRQTYKHAMFYYILLYEF